MNKNSEETEGMIKHCEFLMNVLVAEIEGEVAIEEEVVEEVLRCIAELR